MAEFTLSSVGRVMKKAGAGRLSVDSKERLRIFMESYAENVAEKAVVLAGHAGRLTVTAEDINLAIV